MPEHIHLTVSEEEAGNTVAFFLRSRFKLSESRIRSLKFDPEGIRLDGVRTRVTARVKAGQVLEVLSSDPAARPEKLKPAAIPLQIVYEDEALLAVNKPAGLVCHPAGGHQGDTLANALRAYFDETDPKARIHLAGRLDKDTSGLLLCAKNAAAAEHLRRLLAAEGFGKTYLALAAGCFAQKDREGEICLPLRALRDPESGLIRMTGTESGEKEARTLYRVEKRFSAYALLRLRLCSGRTHQIRAHLAAIGHPLLGDPLYGNPCVNQSVSDKIRRTALHAAGLEFIHPLTQEPIRLYVPLPEDMAALLS